MPHFRMLTLMFLVLAPVFTEAEAEVRTCYFSIETTTVFFGCDVDPNAGDLYVFFKNRSEKPVLVVEASSDEKWSTADWPGGSDETRHTLQLLSSANQLLAQSRKLECDFHIKNGMLLFKCLPETQYLKHYELRCDGEIVKVVTDADCESKFCEEDWTDKSFIETSVFAIDGDGEIIPQRSELHSTAFMLDNVGASVDGAASTQSSTPNEACAELAVFFPYDNTTRVAPDDVISLTLSLTQTFRIRLNVNTKSVMPEEFRNPSGIVHFNLRATVPSDPHASTTMETALKIKEDIFNDVFDVPEGQNRMRITTSPMPRLPDGARSPLFCEFSVSVKRKKAALYLVLVYSEQNRGHLPSRSGMNWDTVAAACGETKPQYLDDSDAFFPNSTVTDCTNSLLSRVRESLSEQGSIEERYQYVVIVTDPIGYTTNRAGFGSESLPESPYRALESMLDDYSPAVANARRSDAGVGPRRFGLDLAGDVELGMVAVQTSVLSLFLPFRDVRVAGVSSWAASACMFWTTARAAFPGDMYRFMDLVAQGGRSSEFLRQHYGDTKAGSGEVWESACEVATDVAMSEVQTETGLGLLMGGPRAWLHGERAREVVWKGRANLHSVPADLFRDGGCVLSGECSSLVESSWRGWRAARVAHKNRVDSLQEFSESQSRIFREVLGSPVPLKTGLVSYLPRLEAGGEQRLREAQATMLRLNRQPGVWDWNHKEWKVAGEAETHRFRLQENAQEHYCSRLSVGNLCFWGDSTTLSFFETFGDILNGTSIADSIWERPMVKPMFLRLERCGGAVNITYQRVLHAREFAAHMRSVESGAMQCDAIHFSAGLHAVLGAINATEGDALATRIKYDESAAELRAVLLDWTQMAASATVPLIWISPHAIFSRWVQTPKLKFYEMTNDYAEYLMRLYQLVIDTFKIPTIWTWEMTLALGTGQYKDSIHTDSPVNAIKCAMLLDYLLGADRSG